MTTSESPYSFAVLRNQYIVRGTLTALTGLRIGAGRSSEVGGSDLPVLRDARGRPFLPGASLKGALRARVEALIASVRPEQVRDLEGMQAHQQEIAKKKQVKQDDASLSAQIWAASTLIELTFGAQWTASRIFVKDALVDESLWFGQFEVRNGVGIDRDTETAGTGLLYDYEVVPAGTRFDFALTMENAEPWQLGMLTLALKPWERGEVQIGGFRSRGLGHVNLEIAEAVYRELNSVDDLLDMLDPRGGSSVTEAQVTMWRDAFKQVLINPARAISAEESHA
ncbi:CRISPR-associated RAMP protein Csx7 [Candidatus Chloroploca sp. Khr17]|uniref:type III CRISPR-associated RAMP protein Csx7 n=1 Tax=Candidatus Chloroploca sp. Khr17 TaxID=2496869 RepID=UPI00101CDEFA|nr:CRISPR-associated RAMP protein Csx7 [Candidatus Chloroploca sp. Khr17]